MSSEVAFAFTQTSSHWNLQPLTSSPSRHVHPHNRLPRPLHSSPNNNNNNEEEENDNPYSDPDYPDLEFINYNDPNYSAFQDEDIINNPPSSKKGLTEEETLAEIESMRESRRKRNDEFQFETYHSKVLRSGEITRGEWTVFQTDTFMGDSMVGQRDEGMRHIPRLLKWDKTLKVISRGYKVILDEEAEWRVDGERIVHCETLAGVEDFPYMDNVEIQWDEEERLHLENTFWPGQLESLDFRGPGGNMCVGKAYTICDAVPIEEKGDEDRHDGPFSEMRTELGVADRDMRFRVKLDYAILEEDEGSASPPPLHLRTLTVCRETLDGFWPKPIDNGIDLEAEEDMTTLPESTARRKDQDKVDVRLFGPSGANGGLYDPPPVGSEERATQNYMLLDFEGGATLLLPHRLDQHHAGDEENENSHGWVTSLDWTPGEIRYQVDRKVLSGKKLKGLKTLELSEVVGQDADKWRPKDGGVDMRQ